MNKLQTVLTVICLTGFISACGLSSGDKDATATQAAAWNFATLTASIPTSTTTKTATVTSTITPTSTTTPTRTPAPLKGVITFDSDREIFEGAYGIFIMNMDGTGEELLLVTSPGGGDMYSDWSPDGKHIVFHSYRSDNSTDLYLMNSDGTGMVQISDTPEFERKPSFSPDGKKIAYLSTKDSEEEEFDLYIMNIDGSDKRLVIDNAYGFASPSWSPDGSKIAFDSLVNNTPQIFMIDIDGTNLTQLTLEESINAAPDWSPDGKKIAFVSKRDDNVDIYVMNADGTNVERLTTHQSRDISPDWSPDGKSIAFSSDRAGNFDIFVMEADGSNVRQYTDDSADDDAPRWSPYGVTMSDEPWFGPPFCVSDTDGDFVGDTFTNVFTTDDMLPYLAFPYRNMKKGMDYGVTWDLNDLPIFEPKTWDEEPSGWTSERGSIMLTGEGKLTITLSINDRQVQQIVCEVVKP